ncbi:hypothetical protein [Aliiroseovarius sp.]|uniref:hypothetical protein n=1 Tax=Aliiroseovarius sp. TaxID=1872442 RepID=UPI003BA9CDF4
MKRFLVLSASGIGLGFGGAMALAAAHQASFDEVALAVPSAVVEPADKTQAIARRTAPVAIPAVVPMAPVTTADTAAPEPAVAFGADVARLETLDAGVMSLEQVDGQTKPNDGARDAQGGSTPFDLVSPEVPVPSDTATRRVVTQIPVAPSGNLNDALEPGGNSWLVGVFR